eukprot:TRINITY_DN3684_c0_g3_i1.p1 TRINITY_DN3684_c0_g3~~TRINITY_DN3684_c0_g3_i1.p1  ORF type:complete len:740 (-),score=390.53 TRINITY_DN3684_c0_g3_i1:133-2352(-)
MNRVSFHLVRSMARTAACVAPVGRHVAALAARCPAPMSPIRPAGSALPVWRRAISTNAPAAAAADEPAAEAQAVQPLNSEVVVGQAQKHEFQAETRKLLDIVARSLYTDKEVFVRELVSNASDALEKLRHRQLTSTGGQPADAEVPTEINIFTDDKANTLIIQDSGIGMTRDELVTNLGRIGYSGSLEFVKQAQASGDASARDIIGQFGVGFYSAFMVGDRVTVYSRAAAPGSVGYMWTSDGTGAYEISEAEGVARGTKIIIHLNDKSHEFASQQVVNNVLKKHSTFVGFPVRLNGKQINTLKALWTMSKDQISADEHKEFYQFIAHAWDDPLFKLHYSTDSPINIRSLFYVGHSHTEKFGMGRLEPGVNLYSRKVLIQAKAKNLLPDWLRFIKGVVDSEDIPLNLSREHLQDSALIKRIGTVLSKRIMKWLDQEAKRDAAKYNTEFFAEFGSFLKEGACTDHYFKDDIAKLLRMESSKVASGELTSFEEYLERAKPAAAAAAETAGESAKAPAAKTNIYYLVAPSRAVALASPYYEAFKAKDKEVLLMYSSLDDFVMANLGEFQGAAIISIESAAAAEAIKKLDAEAKDADKPADAAAKLSGAELQEFISWLKDTLSGQVSTIKESDRLVDSPAIIVDHESASYRRMMKYVDPSRAPELPKQALEINPKHTVIRKLNAARLAKPNLAKLVAEQVFENALVSAGLLDDARSMVGRLNRLMDSALEVGADVEPEVLTQSK